MGADVELVMQLHDKLGALLMHPQVRNRVHRTGVTWVLVLGGASYGMFRAQGS
jgi:hypothetical protein